MIDPFYLSLGMIVAFAGVLWAIHQADERRWRREADDRDRALRTPAE